MGGGGGGEGEGGGRVPALISTFENFANFTKIYWRTQFCKFFCQGYNLLPGQRNFRRHVQSNFDFFIFFLLVNDFFKPFANSLSLFIN